MGTHASGRRPWDYDTTTPNVTLGYDSGATNAKGRLVSVANSNATQSIAGYDALGRITGSTQASSGQNYTFSYTYNLADSLTSTTYPSGRVVTNSYDGANRTSKVYAGSKNYVSSVTYAPHGAYAAFTFGNSMARTNSYNNRLQPSEMKDVQSGQSTAAIDLLYYWNYNSPATSSTTNNGNLTNVQVNTQALGMLASNYYQTFGYDNVNRVSTAGDNGGYGWSQNFGYDQFGNMWLSSFSGIVTPNLTPSLQSKINAATNHVSLASGTAYDGNGNLTTFGSSTLTYDTNNMMIGVAGSATYAYDGLGQRVSKAYGGVTTVYAYDAFGNPAAEYSSAATSLPVCATCYLSWDQLGSTRLVTDQNATPVARHDFLPFGGEITGAYASRPSLWGTSDNVDPKFTGQFRDVESGLDFFNSRYHAQAMGRLLSADPGQAGADPENPQSWNGYAYTINSPLTRIDPSGMDSFDGGGTGDPCIDDPFLCGDGGDGPDWPTQPPPPPPPPLPPVVTSSGVPNTTGVYGWPNGERLGLPPGLSIPSPLSPQVLLGLEGWDCSGGICVPGFTSDWDPNGTIGPRQPGSYSDYAWCWVGALPKIVGTAALGVGLTAAANHSFPLQFFPPKGLIGKVPGRAASLGLKWGAKGSLVGILIFGVTLHVEGYDAARSCSQATNYTPWILQ